MMTMLVAVVMTTTVIMPVIVRVTVVIVLVMYMLDARGDCYLGSRLRIQLLAEQ